MHKSEYVFSQKTVTCYFDADFIGIADLVKDANIIIVTDENVFNHHAEKLAAF